MKRLFYLFFLAVAIVAAGCSGNAPTPKSASSIKGHTYRYAEGSNYVSMYFAYSGTCTYTHNIDGDFLSTSNLIYKISGTNVDIYTDNSTNWAENKRNTLLYHMVYLSSYDALSWEGLILKFYN